MFHVPLIGLNSDRNWFWLINVAGSFLVYTLIRGAVQKYQQLAQYLFNENKQDTARVVLLNTTQIMTSGERPATAAAEYARSHFGTNTSPYDVCC